MVKVGELLAAQVLRSAHQMKTGQPLHDPIRYSSETLNCSKRWETGKTMAVGITTVLIDREIAIAAVPGEPMHRLQTAWKTNPEAAFPMFFGYTLKDLYGLLGMWKDKPGKP